MVIHVAKTGNDSNDGTTYALAKLTIANAITTAAAGDTIYIWPGSYAEALTVNKDNLLFQGSSWGCIITSSGVGTPTITITANGVHFETLQIKHTGTTVASKDCVAIKAADTYLMPHLKGCYVVSSDVCVWFDGDGYSVRNCILDGKEYGIYTSGIAAPKFGATIKNVLISLSGWTVCTSSGIYLVSVGKVNLQNVQISVNVTTADGTHKCQGIGFSGLTQAVMENVVIKTITGNTAYEEGLSVAGGGPNLSYVSVKNFVIVQSGTSNTYSLKITASCVCAVENGRYDVSKVSGIVTQINPYLHTAVRLQKSLLAGTWRAKPGDATKQELLDVDDGATILLEQTLSETSPYRTTTVIVS